MFKSYFKVSIRGLMKNPLSSFINVFGLSVAVGICIVAYAFIENDYSIDQFHENKNKIYLTTFVADRDGALQQYGRTPRPIGEMLREDFAQIRKVCRVDDRQVVVKQTDNIFYERVRFVDPEFLNMFTFPLKWGVKSSLSDLNSIIISDDMSIKYFGDQNPIGQDLMIIFNGQNKKAFKVIGVAAPFPKAHDIDFNFLINFENVLIADPQYKKSDWGGFVNATFVQIDNPSNVRTIEQGMGKYTAMYNKAQSDWAIASFILEPLTSLHENSGHIRDGITNGANEVGRIGMTFIAILMIALACFNYINIAIVSATKRLKEIAVRKVIGASRHKVIVQFLTENTVTTFFSLIVGFVFGVGIFLPWFVQFSGYNLELKLLNGQFWFFLCLLMLFTGVASGIYPAFYISSFDAVKIFKGSLQFGKSNPITKIFLSVQMILACITITMGVVFTQNNSFQHNLNWGYHQKGAIYASVPDQASFEKLSASMLSNPNVLEIAGSKNHLGKDVSSAVVKIHPNHSYEVDLLSVDADYLETLGLQLKEGRYFKKHYEGDKRMAVVNELLIKKLNLINPIGHQFEMDSIRYEIIGVLKDFHTENLFHDMKPTFFKLADDKDYRYLSLRLKEGSEKETYKALQYQWATLYPDVPFQGGYQEDVWANYFQRVDKSGEFNNVVAFMAVLLASLGLYGLVSLNISGRVKEFSIRKLLGAEMKNLATLITQEYALLTIITLAIGAPVSYLLTKAYLTMFFAYAMPMGYFVVIIPIMILIAIFLMVVSTQVLKILKSNSVNGLKAE